MSLNPHFSFIVLTYNEEMHLPRLLDSIAALQAAVYVLDSYSNDHTQNICEANQVTLSQHPFYNHPQQWAYALQHFPILTPWVICLDADQYLSDELFHKLQDFKDEEQVSIDGIYFNRKNYFKGKWIKYGGYYPKYLLKMFRYDKGWSDLNENMDHRFQVPGKTLIWKTGHLIEENLKENQIAFWISKHNRYSDLLAEEALQKEQKQISWHPKPMLFGSPNQRKLWLKIYWNKLPLYYRPFVYFFYRFVLRGGFLDGKRGMIFHFLQAFWFRLLVDIKIDEARHQRAFIPAHFKFLVHFILGFALLYGFHLVNIALTSPGGFYLGWLDQHVNYIKYWREFDINVSAYLLRKAGFEVCTSVHTLHVEGHAGFRLVYSCLGYGTMSGFSAFVIAFPKSKQSKIRFLIRGLLMIQILNLIRLMLIALFFNSLGSIDHHLLFNTLCYFFISSYVYQWINKPN